jgi:hypothetical protein
VDETSGKLSANITATKDPMLQRSTEKFQKHVKNIYLALFTRGMKGCYFNSLIQQWRCISGEGWKSARQSLMQINYPLKIKSR